MQMRAPTAKNEMSGEGEGGGISIYLLHINSYDTEGWGSVGWGRGD